MTKDTATLKSLPTLADTGYQSPPMSLSRTALFLVAPAPPPRAHAARQPHHLPDDVHLGRPHRQRHPHPCLASPPALAPPATPSPINSFRGLPCHRPRRPYLRLLRRSLRLGPVHQRPDHQNQLRSRLPVRSPAPTPSNSPRRLLPLRQRLKATPSSPAASTSRPPSSPTKPPPPNLRRPAPPRARHPHPARHRPSRRRLPPLPPRPGRLL